ncbi:DUF2853 family protein [Flavobacteriaceae bacterium F08102]|nr:DUF2853 family protein [Flavobacteriaceae bacterium F08102]
MSDLADKLAAYKEQAISQLKDSGVTNIDDDQLDELVGRMKLIINNRDAILVSGTDSSELETVRTNFVVKKLGVEDKEKGMKAIHAVADKMSGIKMKNRAAFYYLVKNELS